MTENDRNDRDDRTGGPAGAGGPTPGGGATPPPYAPPPAPPQGAPGGAGEPARPDQPGQAGGRRGQIRRQEPGVTQPRPPSLAEQRARTAAAERKRQERLEQEAEEARRRKLRKRLLIGGGVTVGVVGVVAIWYAAASPDDVEAQCTQDGVVVDDQYCDENYARSHGGYSSGGFIYIGGTSYRYHYGGSSVPVGQKVSGGSYTIPKGANVTTKSGTTIQRGGFGVSNSKGVGG
ncbi:hypothetical protein [Saccharothrix algeriensis]|uniref:Type II secretory pathway pseudopilin PulG n=1 Tax=Saccharothrix algeriensis TaxID=173560 RepID=A0ABS2SAE3_9PSEU|nr:hypothetical protein [Saccharothrix algeriensis]MBM7812051.1 type II secretory pathway pseudopilin PulG [Saccharothrix algeriensis]